MNHSSFQRYVIDGTFIPTIKPPHSPSSLISIKAPRLSQHASPIPPVYLPVRLSQESISFRLCAQIAEEGDVTGDATVHWPDNGRMIGLGTLKLDAVAPDNEKQQRQIIFDTLPRVKGIEPSDDPLLEMRAAAYLIIGKQHRVA